MSSQLQLALNKQQPAEQQISTHPTSFRNGIIANSKTHNETNHHLESTHTLSSTFDALESSHKHGLVQSQIKHDNHNALLSKYEQMRQIGVSIDIIILQMRKDKITENIINNFSSQNSNNKFNKYNIMKTNGAPFKTVLNTMSFDGLSESDIDEYCSELKESDFELPQTFEITAPTHKMKHINWQPIKLQNINNSLWNDINHKWNDYNYKQIESKFKIKLKAIKLDQTHLINNVSIPFSTENNLKQVKFIPPIRNKQVKDSLKEFNMTNLELRDCILSMNDNKINIIQLKILLEIIPTPCEQLMADRMSELQNVKSFGITERFFYSLCDIIELKQRINNWVFKLEFQLRIKELIEKITVIETAKLTVVLSKEFKQILNIILMLGNFMNYNNKSNNNAYGFCISDLNLLQEIKTSDNSMTFLMYLCSILQTKYPSVLTVIETFKIIHQAAVISSENIYKLYSELLIEINDLNTLLIRYKNQHYQIPNSNDMFYSKMVNFQQIIQQNMNELKLKMDGLHKCEKELIEYFGFSHSNNHTNIQKIFQFISTFIFELQYSNINLKQFEQIKKKIRSNKKRIHKKKGQRRAVTGRMTQENMKKYAKPQLKTATSFDNGNLKKHTKNHKYKKNGMNTFDENKETIEYTNNIKTTPKTRLKLMVSQSADTFIGSSPLTNKKNIISFSPFNNNKKNNAIIHSYDYSGNFNNYNPNIIEENQHTTVNTNANINAAAIVHSYYVDSEPSSPNHRKRNHVTQNSFCLYKTNSQLVEQKFGATLDSPTVNNNTNELHQGFKYINATDKFQSI